MAGVGRPSSPIVLTSGGWRLAGSENWTPPRAERAAGGIWIPGSRKRIATARVPSRPTAGWKWSLWIAWALWPLPLSPTLAACAACRGSLGWWREYELPLVVMISTFVQPDGLFFALARDASDAAERCSRRADAGCRRKGRAPQAGVGAAPCGRRWLPGSLLRCNGEKDWNEIVIGDRIFVLLAEKSLVYQEIDVGRQRSWTRFPLEQADRPRVLLAAEHELGFLLPSSHLVPHRHRRRHHDRRDAQADEQRGHGVSLLTP